MTDTTPDLPDEDSIEEPTQYNTTEPDGPGDSVVAREVATGKIEEDDR